MELIPYYLVGERIHAQYEGDKAFKHAVCALGSVAVGHGSLAVTVNALVGIHADAHGLCGSKSIAVEEEKFDFCDLHFLTPW